MDEPLALWLGNLNGEFLSQFSRQRSAGSFPRFDVATREVPDVRIPPQRRTSVAQQHTVVADKNPGHDEMCIPRHGRSFTCRWAVLLSATRPFGHAQDCHAHQALRCHHARVGTRFRVSIAVGVLSALIGVVAPLSAFASKSHKPIADGSWSVRADYPASITFMYSVGCPTVSTCIALTSASDGTSDVLLSTNGGASWTIKALPSDINNLYSVECASSRVCYVAAGDSGGPYQQEGTILKTSNGGATWIQQHVPTKAAIVDAVSCSSTTECVAVGSTDGLSQIAVGTSNGGTTWSVLRIFPNLTDLNGVDCTSSLTCIAVGDRDGPSATGTVGAVISTADGGKTWTEHGLPHNTYSFNAITCSTSSDCVAVGTFLTSGAHASYDAQVITTSDAGAHWTLRRTEGTSDLTGVQCTSPLDCMAVGDELEHGSRIERAEVLYSTDGGQSWVTHMLRGVSGIVDGLSCTAQSSCELVGTQRPANGAYPGSGFAGSTTNGGASWSRQTLPTGIDDLFGVSCGSRHVCIAVGANQASGQAVVVRSTDSGTTWHEVADPWHATSLVNVSCASSLDCVAVGGTSTPPDHAFNRGAIESTVNGGRSWKARTFGPRFASMAGVSCPTRLVCDVAGGALLSETGPDDRAFVLRTTDQGKEWKSLPLPGDVTSLAGVTCNSALSCVIFGQAAKGLTQPFSGVPGNHVYGVIFTTSDGGLHWDATNVPKKVVGVSDVACEAPLTCVATGGTNAGPVILRTTDAGHHWSVKRVFRSGNDALGSVACISRERCVALGVIVNADFHARGFALVSTDGGVNWTAQGFPKSQWVTDLSCERSGPCVALGGVSGAEIMEASGI